jgi:hypothetical protein
MLYCLVERKSEGGKQINRVELPIEVDCGGGWEGTNKLFKEGKISKAIKVKYSYISVYEPLDWLAEEDGMSGTGSYYPI